MITKNTITLVEMPTHSQFDNLLHRTFHALTVLGYAGGDSAHHYWWCECECGNVSRPSANALKRDRAKSCGCLRAIQCGNNFRTHGKRRTAEYAVWHSMLDRCRNVNNDAFSNYGERGITVCDRWHQFENFLEDMGERPSPQHTLERVDNDLGYCPENCVWDTRLVQGNNKRNNKLFTFQGKTQSLSMWSREYHINLGTLRNRLITRQWSIEKALTSPLLVNQYG